MRGASRWCLAALICAISVVLGGCAGTPVRDELRTTPEQSSRSTDGGDACAGERWNRYAAAVEVATRQIRSRYLDDVEPGQLIESCQAGLRKVLPAGIPPDAFAGSSAQRLPGRANRCAIEIALRLAPKVSPQTLADGCLRALVESLAGSEYFDALQVSARDDRSTGMAIQRTATSGLVVSGVLPGGPAHRAGLRRGDVIVRIAGKSATELSPSDAVALMGGPAGSEVSVTVAGNAASSSVDHLVRRGETGAAATAVLPEGIIYMRIARFVAGGIDAFAADLRKQFDAHAGILGGVIIDLRDNRGGMFSGAIGVTSAFLPQETLIVSSEERSSRDGPRRHLALPEEYATRGKPDPLRDLPRAALTVPLVVLVNQATAGGAELVAAALQDHRRAVIVGVRTSGDCIGQTIEFLLEGRAMMKLKTQRFRTPAGRNIHGAGVQPDVVVQGADRETGERIMVPPAADAAVIRAMEILRDLRVPADGKTRRWDT